MANPHYGSWEYDDTDDIGYSEDGSPYVRPIHRCEAQITYPPPSQPVIKIATEDGRIQ